MVDYTKIQATAQRLISKNGKTVTMKLLNKGTDDDKPWRGGDGTYAASTDVKAVELGANTELAAYGIKIKKEDVPDSLSGFFLIALTPSTPDLQDYDELWDGTTRYRLCLMQSIKPANTVLLWIAGVER